MITLKEIAYSRTEDKGSSPTIGIVAYTDEGFDFLKNHLTEDCVFAFLKDFHLTKVERYDLPSLNAINFVLSFSEEQVPLLTPSNPESLEKNLGLHLLGMEIDLPESLLPNCLPPSRNPS